MQERRDWGQHSRCDQRQADANLSTQSVKAQPSCPRHDGTCNYHFLKKNSAPCSQVTTRYVYGLFADKQYRMIGRSCGRNRSCPNQRFSFSSD